MYRLTNKCLNPCPTNQNCVRGRRGGRGRRAQRSHCPCSPKGPAPTPGRASSKGDQAPQCPQQHSTWWTHFVTKAKQIHNNIRLCNKGQTNT